jgi:DnaJ-class molecular chaperone
VTHYEILGVPPATTLEKIHERYLELAFTYHPDRGGDAVKCREVNLAWGVLKSNRKLYDLKLKVEGKLCPTCQGSGVKWKLKGEIPCPECRGSGISGSQPARAVKKAR